MLSSLAVFATRVFEVKPGLLAWSSCASGATASSGDWLCEGRKP